MKWFLYGISLTCFIVGGVHESNGLVLAAGLFAIAGSLA